MKIPSNCCTGITIGKMVQLNQSLQKALDEFLHSAQKTKKIAEEVLADTRSANDFDIALSESTLAKHKVDHLRQEIGEKTFAYFMQEGSDMEALAKALYEEPAEQAAFLERLSAALLPKNRG